MSSSIASNFCTFGVSTEEEEGEVEVEDCLASAAKGTLALEHLVMISGNLTLHGQNLETLLEIGDEIKNGLESMRVVDRFMVDENWEVLASRLLLLLRIILLTTVIECSTETKRKEL